MKLLATAGKALKFIALFLAIIVVVSAGIFLYSHYQVWTFKIRLSLLKNFQLNKFSYYFEPTTDWWAEGKVKDKGPVALWGGDIPKNINSNSKYIGLTKIDDCEIKITAGIPLSKLETPIMKIQDVVDSYEKILKEVKEKNLCKRDKGSAEVDLNSVIEINQKNQGYSPIN